MDRYGNLIGTVLDGRYRLEEIVGEGGMAIVLKARDLTENRAVAIKMLNEESAADETAVQRFTNESRAVAMLSHPCVVTVYDVHISGESKYIVMEFIDGVTLKDYMDKKGRLEWREAVHYVTQILGALSHAHAKQVIHRDVKPQNIMLLKNGQIKVTDFGIAKLPDSKSITVTDKAIGTVNYISPEQASGNGSTYRSDIYSTGVMLYEMVTGKLPFVSGSAVSVAMMHVSSEPVLPTEICKDIPKGLEQIIIKAMNKDPERRFGSASAMKKALEFLLLNPEAIFKEKAVIGPDGKPITGTGAAVSAVRAVDAENEAEEKERPSMFPIVLGVTLAFFLVAIGSLFFALHKIGIEELLSGDPVDNAENTKIIPDLVGETYTQWLADELTADGYRLEVEYVYNLRGEKDEIMAQDPAAKSERKVTENGVPLKLSVNSGNSDVVLDDYRITEQRETTLALESMGVTVKTVEEFSDTVIQGYVIRTDPEEGATVHYGDTVTLYVSKGQEKNTVKMPDIVGMTVSQAERELIRRGIAVGERSYAPSDKYPDGTVLSASIREGTLVTPKQTSVDLVISKTEVTDTPVETAAIVPSDAVPNSFETAPATSPAQENAPATETNDAGNA